MSSTSLLPVPKPELYTNWGLKGILGVLGCVGLWVLGPKLLVLLGLVASLATGLIGTIATLFALVMVVYMVPWALDIGSSIINVVARKIAWTVWEWDPIEPIRQCLFEVQRDGLEFKRHLDSLASVQVNVERKRDAFIEQADNAEVKAKRYYDQKQTELFKSESYAAGEYRNAASKFDKMVNNLQTLWKEIKQLYDLYQAEQKKLEIDMDVQKNLWESGLATGGAISMADKLLSKSSKKRRFADEARSLIEQKYANNIGRLRSLKDLSGNLIASFDADKGEYSEQLLKKWNVEKEALLLEHLPSNALPVSVETKQNSYV